MDKVTRHVWISGFLCGLLALALLSSLSRETVDAQMTQVERLDAFAYEEITLGTGAASQFTAATVSPTTAPGAKAAVCTLEGTTQARYRMDGTAPTTTVGHLTGTPTAAAPVSLTVLGTNSVIRFRAIAASGTPSLRCTYLR